MTRLRFITIVGFLSISIYGACYFQKVNQCNKAYAIYTKEMTEINHLAEYNGWGPQPVYSKENFCG